MTNFLRRITPLRGLMAALALFLALFYGKVIISPDSYLFNDEGDAVTTYYHALYYIVHDTDYAVTRSVHYPYGEHVVYGIHGLALPVALKALSGIFPGLGDFTVGIINLFLVLSPIPCALLLFVILKRHGATPWLAAAGAMGITVLSPVVFRMTGHLFLSPAFFFPLTWYVVLRSSGGRGFLWWNFLLMVNVLAWFFVHSYLGMMAAFFAVAYAAAKAAMVRGTILRRLAGLLPVVPAVAAVVAYFVITTSTDTRDDRTTNPAGFFLYNAEPDDVLLPHYSPLRPLWDALIPGIRQQWEAWSYVGFPSVVLLIAALVFTISGLRKEQRLPSFRKWMPDPHLPVALAAAFVLLLFAFGMPFRQFPDLLDALPLVKHFRSTGRFTWPFYYVMTATCVVAASGMYEALKARGRSRTAIALAAFVPLMFVFEGLPYHADVSHRLTRAGNLFMNPGRAFAEPLQMIPADRYQAILPLPFYHRGSENFGRPWTEKSSLVSKIVAWRTGLPLFSFNSGRTGISESRNIVQLLSPPWYEKAIRHDLDSLRPVLIVHSNEALTPYEEDMLRRSSLIYRGGTLSLYEILPAKLFESTAAGEIARFHRRRDKLFSRKGFLVSDSAAFIHYDDFDQRAGRPAFAGRTSFEGPKAGKNLLAAFPPRTFSGGSEYTASVWMYNARQDALNEWLRFAAEEYDPVNDVWETTWVLPELSEVIHGEWSLVELRFRVTNPSANTVYIVTIGTRRSKGNILADELLVRPPDCDVYRLTAEEGGQPAELYRNGHLIAVPGGSAKDE